MPGARSTEPSQQDPYHFSGKVQQIGFFEVKTLLSKTRLERVLGGGKILWVIGILLELGLEYMV